jgi:hypothetical protein
LAREKYFCAKSVPVTGAILIELQTWTTRLQRSRILKLLEIPHFGRSLEINSCVKILLSCVNGGTLWLDPLVSTDTQLIVWIIGFPKVGEDSTTLFTNKAGEKELVESMKDKFNTFRGKRGLDVVNKSDDVVSFDAGVGL